MTAVTERPVAARPTTTRARSGHTSQIVWTLGAWLATLVFILPVMWMVLTSFHPELDAVSNPPTAFAPLILDNYRDLLAGSLIGPLINSITASATSTILVIVLAVPAAYALAIKPVPRWTDVMFFFLSTKMAPAVAGLLPIYLVVKSIGALDNIWTLVVLYLAAGLPLGIWMLTSFFREIPRELIEAAELDGASLLMVVRRVILPLTWPGIAAVALISFIFSWNEFLFALNLTATTAYTTPVYLVGFLSGQRLFLAHLCAASTLVSLPVLIAGFAARNKLVQGLSLGAVK